MEARQLKHRSQKALADFRENFSLDGRQWLTIPRHRSDETNLNATKPICAFDANVLKRMPGSFFATTRRGPARDFRKFALTRGHQ
jgi:hypothetical protein